MTVLDASALVELVLQTPTGRVLADRISNPALRLDVPHLADLEVANALRRYVREAKVEVTDAATALMDLRALDLRRHAHEPLLDRIWELRENLSPYDAAYVALAEALDTTVVSCDARLAHAPGVGRRVEFVAAND